VPGETLSLMDVALLSRSVGAILLLGFGFFGLLLFYKQVVVFSFGLSGGGGTANGLTTALVLGTR
jgi:hypothetical protein